MLEYLPSNHKALGLVPITEKSIQFSYCKILISLSLKISTFHRQECMKFISLVFLISKMWFDDHIVILNVN